MATKSIHFFNSDERSQKAHRFDFGLGENKGILLVTLQRKSGFESLAETNI